MSDKSNWKNKNRDILKGAIKGVKKIAAPFIKEAVGLRGDFLPSWAKDAKVIPKKKNRDILKGAVEGVKKIAKPFIKESIYIDKIIKSKKKKKD